MHVRFSLLARRSGCDVSQPHWTASIECSYLMCHWSFYIVIYMRSHPESNSESRLDVVNRMMQVSFRDAETRQWATQRRAAHWEQAQCDTHNWARKHVAWSASGWVRHSHKKGKSVQFTLNDRMLWWCTFINTGALFWAMGGGIALRWVDDLFVWSYAIKSSTQ